jgi:hypothetical protein
MRSGTRRATRARVFARPTGAPNLLDRVGFLQRKHAGTDQRDDDVRRANDLDPGAAQTSETRTRTGLLPGRRGISGLVCNGWRVVDRRRPAGAVATWIEASTRELAASVKQRLAALRHLFD